MMYQNPALFHKLMDRLTEAVIRYVQAQIDAGVNAIQIFDSWVGSLSPLDFNIYALPYVQKIVTAVKTKLPIIYFAFNGSAMLPLVKQSGPMLSDLIGASRLPMRSKHSARAVRSRATWTPASSSALVP